jgi:DNA/RNA-binding domain of Phe-tRNA-synthetase-like protein
MEIQPHELLDAATFLTRFPAPLSELASPDWLQDLLRPGSEAPLAPDDQVKAAVRNLFRVAGYKPTGRGKPASEYLVRAASLEKLSTINPAVDVCNAVSYHSGLPVSVVDTALAAPPYRIGIAAGDGQYVFNRSGQEIRFEGLFTLYDADGPCANGVKDSQRTKTGDGTTATLTVIWGTTSLPGRTAIALDWYRELLHRLGAVTDCI